MKIIDAHQHFWDIEKNYLPWLSDQTASFRYGDYSALRCNYLPEHYRADSSDFEIAGTVFVETEWDPTDPLGEVVWVAKLREQEGLPTVMVAQAWLDRADVEQVLSAHGQTSFVRGIRHKPKAVARPEDVELGLPGSMGDPDWRRGYALLAPNGLSFDLQTPWWHFQEALELAEAFPETQIIVNHTGLPSDRSEAALLTWRHAINLLAKAPNVAIKISGIGIPGQPWTVEANRWVVLETISAFGPSRCMFASNFPVDRLVADFKTIFAGFQTITAAFSQSECAAMFYANAIKFYRMSDEMGD